MCFLNEFLVQLFSSSGKCSPLWKSLMILWKPMPSKSLISFKTDAATVTLYVAGVEKYSFFEGQHIAKNKNSPHQKTVNCLK